MTNGQHTYTYDADGKVLQVDSGTSGSYVYDAMEHRVRISTQAYDREFLYDPFGRRQSTWQVSGNAATEGRVYWDYGLLVNRSQNGQTYFHHGNYLGTERVRTDASGNTADTLTSLPFSEGSTRSSGDYSGAAQDENEFTSQDHDAETNTEHFQYRQYNENQGRWLSPDPYSGSYDPGNPQSLNRYSYVMNNPLALFDPDGFDECVVGGVYTGGSCYTNAGDLNSGGYCF